MGKTKNKVKYGLSNVHYALENAGEDGAITYGTPKRIPGAVNLSLSAKGDKTSFSADDDPEYFSIYPNDGYEGDVEAALIPDEFRIDCLGETLDGKKVMIENGEVLDTPHFALLFEFKGDKSKTRHVLYHCKASRPGIEGTTKGTSVDVKTEKISLVASPRPDTGDVKAKTTEDTDPEAYKDWYTKVYEKTPAETVQPAGDGGTGQQA